MLINRGEAKGDYWWGAQPEFADKHTFLKLLLEFYHKYNVDKHY